MFEVIYMKAEYEPWWMFGGWEEKIISRYSFPDFSEAAKCLDELVVNLRKSYKNESEKYNCYYALWSEEEKIFCEACDDDLQIYHGIILLKEGKPFTS
ncbi:DUF1033 family protein [Sporosarcina sp. CAU 1771]